MNWALRNYYDKDIKSDIIDEKSDAGGIAAGGISPENICSASCNHVQHCFICVVNKVHKSPNSWLQSIAMFWVEQLEAREKSEINLHCINLVLNDYLLHSIGKQMICLLAQLQQTEPPKDYGDNIAVSLKYNSNSLKEYLFQNRWVFTLFIVFWTTPWNAILNTNFCLV